MVYSTSERKCTKICCTNGKYYNWDLERCVCPLAQPYEEDSGKCVSCVLPKFWNKETKSCDSCGKSFYYDVAGKECLACPADRPISGGICCTACPEELSYNRNINACVCPEDKPYRSGNECYSCDYNQFWNIEKSRC